MRGRSPQSSWSWSRLRVRGLISAFFHLFAGSQAVRKRIVRTDGQRQSGLACSPFLGNRLRFPALRLVNLAGSVCSPALFEAPAPGMSSTQYVLPQEARKEVPDPVVFMNWPNCSIDSSERVSYF